MTARLEIAPGCFVDAAEAPRKSVNLCQHIIDQISDPVVSKLLIMRWWERGEITPADAETLIRGNGLESD